MKYKHSPLLCSQCNCSHMNLNDINSLHDIFVGVFYDTYKENKNGFTNVVIHS